MEKKYKIDDIEQDAMEWWDNLTGSCMNEDDYWEDIKSYLCNLYFGHRDIDSLKSYFILKIYKGEFNL